MNKKVQLKEEIASEMEAYTTTKDATHAIRMATLKGAYRALGGKTPINLPKESDTLADWVSTFAKLTPKLQGTQAQRIAILNKYFARAKTPGLVEVIKTSAGTLGVYLDKRGICTWPGETPIDEQFTASTIVIITSGHKVFMTNYMVSSIKEAYKLLS